LNYLLQTPPPKLKAGDYVTTRGSDTEAERVDCERVLRQNGCKSIRFETFPDGRLQAHGYLAEIYGS
jgi:hypothetical protein